MIKIDITLRDVISKLPQNFIKLLTNKKGVKLLDTSLPEVKDKRADLIVEMEDKSIFHLELQTFNDKNMNYRMLEYYLLIRKKFKTDNIEQMVLYVGEKELNMPNNIKTKNLSFFYTLKDIKEINCHSLINSNDIEDKILAVLCNIQDENRYINAIINELLALNENKRKDYIKKLLSMSRYRKSINEKLINAIKEKVMPITIDIKNDPYYEEGIKEGIKKGIKEGIKLGLEKSIKVLLEIGLSKEEISKKLNLTIKEIDEILKESDVTKNRKMGN